MKKEDYEWANFVESRGGADDPEVLERLHHEYKEQQDYESSMEEAYAEEEMRKEYELAKRYYELIPAKVESEYETILSEMEYEHFYYEPLQRVREPSEKITLLIQRILFVRKIKRNYLPDKPKILSYILPAKIYFIRAIFIIKRWLL